MKKLLGIVVLGLLFSVNAYAEILPNTSPAGQYKFSTELLKDGDYENAEKAFKEFVTKNPKHTLAGNAQYWYAETFRIRGFYTNAAREYLVGYQKYPKSQKGSINLLKLGVVLIYIGEWDQGCLIINGVKKQYPKASQSILSKAKYEHRKMCNDSSKKNDWVRESGEVDIDFKVAEKPKKKEKPKASPDDDKIVPAGSGSGFFVSKDGHAITNYHVIEGCDINKLSFKGSQTEVKVLAVDKVNDIAILKSNTKPDAIFPVSNEDVSLLEDVIVAGFPLGKQISSAIKTHKGVVTALAGAGDNYSFFQTDAAINQGNSGGPIINQKGNVVGIAVATWVEEGVQGVHFGIKSSTLKTFASANGLSFASPNFRDQSNKALGELITKGTVYVECHMTVAKIKKMIAQAENRKVFFKEHK